jgi:hypothetical protein
MKISVRVLSLASCAAALLVLAPAAHAASFTVGALPTFSGPALDTVSGSVLSIPSIPGKPTFTAAYSSSVFTDAISGDLDFVYNVSISSLSGDIVDTLTMSDFDDYITGVGAGGPGVAPDSTVNEIGGIFHVTFNTAGGIGAGEQSETIVLETDATNFTAGTFSAQDGSVAALQGFMPAAATPEPSSFILLGSGLFAAAGMIRRKLSV